MPKGLRDHPQRWQLSAEVHARPFMHLQPGTRASHLALLTGTGGAAAERAHVGELCARYGAPPPAEDSTFHLVDLGPFRLRWERHTEFSSYGFFAEEPVPCDDSGRPQHFSQPVIRHVPADWLAALDGEVLLGLHLEFEPAEAPPLESEALQAILGIDNFAGSFVAGGAARAWLNFTINADGYGRVLVRDDHLRPRQAGRLVQRLFEIETYRMTALLALPVAREIGGDLMRLEDELADLTRRMAAGRRELDSERELLHRIAELSAEIERLAATATFRIGAGRAYYALVRRRTGELREERAEDLQTITEFIERRLAPAMDTCESTAARLEALSVRVTRAGQLLRARVQVQLEAQNSRLLDSMDRRAKMQLRLQETVEGLSVAAITYYAVGLVGYALKAAKTAGLPVPVEIGTGLAIPLVAGCVWLGMRRVRRMVARHLDG